jgi:hypothetical protein
MFSAKMQRLTVFNCIVAFALVYSQYMYGFNDFVTRSDTTYLARVAGIIYVAVSYYIFWTVVKERTIDKGLINFSTNMAVGLGLLGAIIGMSMSYRALETFDPNDILNLIHLIGEVASAGPITTAFGVGVWLLIEAQRFVVELSFKEDVK